MKATKRIFALAGILALSLTAVRAQSDDDLLDALVQKGILSEQEGENIRANAAKKYSETSADKLVISNHITQLKLYGDARLRYEYVDEKAQNNLPTPAGAGVGASDNINERYRYRLRVGLDYTFSDKFNAGFELESSTNNDSANQSFGSEYTKDAINIGLIYLQYKPFDWLTLTGGKQRNPLYTTDLVWDPDINPEGGSEVFNWTFPIGGGGDDSGPASNDPKALKSVSSGSFSDESLTIGLTAFQGIYSDNNEYNTPASNATDVWQFVEQIPVQFNFNKDMFIKEVPGFDIYTSGGDTGQSSSTGTAGGGGTQNFVANNAADHLAIITAPGEFDWKLWNQPFRLYWDFADNTQGKARIQNVYFGNGQTGVTQNTATQNQNRDLGDNIAWLAGLQVGQNKKKGDWSLRSDFRQVGLGSIDPNLNDSDWGDSFLNQQGVKVQAMYNFTDFLVGSLSVTDTWALKKSLLNGGPGQNPTGLPLTTGVSGTTASGIANLAGASQTQRLQVDVMWKF